MKSSAHKVPPRVTTDTIRQYIDALPITEETSLLDERAAQAARSVLGRVDSGLELRLQAQTRAIMEEVANDLDQEYTTGHYVITSLELRGIIAKAVSRAAGQFATDIGQAMVVAESPAQISTDIQTNEEDIPYSQRQLLQGA